MEGRLTRPLEAGKVAGSWKGHWKLERALEAVKEVKENLIWALEEVLRKGLEGNV